MYTLASNLDFKLFRRLRICLIHFVSPMVQSQDMLQVFTKVMNK